MENENPLVPEYILKKLILLYGFNKETLFKTKPGSSDPLTIINFEYYYLINGDWLNKFMDFYNYEQIVKLIKQYNYNYHNYYGYKNNINQILTSIKSFKIRQKGKEFPIELKNGGISFVPKYERGGNNMYYYDHFYIVNSELNQILCQDTENPKPNYSIFFNTINLKSFHSNYSFFIQTSNIEICTINKEGMFISQYHIKLIEENGCPEEEIQNIFKSGGVERFLKSRKYDNKKVSCKFSDKGGIILNIDYIRKEKEEEQKKADQQKEAEQKNDISHSVESEKKFGNNPFYNKNQYQNSINNNPTQSSYNIQNNNNNQNQNLINYYTSDTTKKLISNVQIKNQILDDIKQNNINNANQVNNNINNNNIQVQNNQFNQSNNSFPQQFNNNYNQGQNQYENYNNVNNNFQNPYENNMNANSNFNNFQTPQNPQLNFQLNQNMQNIPNMQNIQNFQNMQNGQNLQNIPNLQNMQNCNMNMFYPQMNMNMNINMSNNFPQQNNANNNTNNFINNITSLKQLNYCPKIGLVNLGQTCYMNSVLQCFSNLYHITNYFLNPKRQEKIKEHMNYSSKDKDSLLCFVYKDLLDNLWKGVPNQPFSPIQFKKRLAKLNPLFEENTAGDSKDFAIYLIMELHNELNNIEQNPNISNFQNIENINVNQFDQNQVFNAFMANFALNQFSIISCYFYGITQGQFECQQCKMKLLNKGINASPIKYNYENFLYLEFPLDEVRKYLAEQNNMLANYQNINKVTLYDCFNYNQKINTFIGYCEKCKIDNAQIKSQNIIYSPSSILMIIFNRGQALQYKIKVDFPQQLDITNIVVNKVNQYYDLRGVVKHFGDSSSSGHFIAYCRSAVPMFNNQWYCFNDNTVVEVNNWNDIVENGDTYILFYELKNIGQ